MDADKSVQLHADAASRRLAMWLQSSGPAMLLRAEAPGQPATTMRPFYMVRARGTRGRLRSVLAWRPGIECVFEPDRIRVDAGVERHTHARIPAGWRMETARDGRSGKVELGGRIAVVRRPRPPLAAPHRTRIRQPGNFGGWWTDLQDSDRQKLFVVQLGENNYRRSEV